MKCELCEGSNIIKQNGVFVCQDCGMKYSVEEARKLINEVPNTTADIPKPEQIEAENAAKYAEANKLLLSGDISKINRAETLFRDLGGYKDASNKLEECKQIAERSRLVQIEAEKAAKHAAKYAEANKLLLSGDISKINRAETLFRDLGDYRDSNDKLEECRRIAEQAKTKQYEEAQSLFEKGTEQSIESAIEKLDELGQFKDASSLSKEYRDILKKEKVYQLISENFDDKNLKDLRDTKDKLEEIKGYKNADDLLLLCNNRLETVMASMYDNALSLAEQQTLESMREARAFLCDLKPYRDSEKKIEELDGLLSKENTYQTATTKMSVGYPIALNSARKQFLSIEEYKDSALKAVECNNELEHYYEKARKTESVLSVASQRNAITMYENLQDYNDSSERVKICQNNVGDIKDVIQMEYVLIGLEEISKKLKNRSKLTAVEEIIKTKSKELDVKKQAVASSVGVDVMSISSEGLHKDELSQINASADQEVKEVCERLELNKKPNCILRVAVVLIVLGIVALLIVKSIRPSVIQQDEESSDNVQVETTIEGEHEQSQKDSKTSANQVKQGSKGNPLDIDWSDKKSRTPEQNDTVEVGGLMLSVPTFFTDNKGTLTDPITYYAETEQKLVMLQLSEQSGDDVDFSIKGVRESFNKGMVERYNESETMKSDGKPQYFEMDNGIRGFYQPCKFKLIDYNIENNPGGVVVLQNPNNKKIVCISLMQSLKSDYDYSEIMKAIVGTAE